MSSVIKNRHKATPIHVASPVTGAFAITPHDTNNLTEPTLSLYIGTAGALKATMLDGSVVTYPVAMGSNAACASGSGARS